MPDITEPAENRNNSAVLDYRTQQVYAALDRTAQERARWADTRLTQQTGNPFASVHREFGNWISRRERAGWPSAEMRAAASVVLRCLWVCRSNPDAPIFVRGLAQSVAALEQAMGE